MRLQFKYSGEDHAVGYALFRRESLYAKRQRRKSIFVYTAILFIVVASGALFGFTRGDAAFLVSLASFVVVCSYLSKRHFRKLMERDDRFSSGSEYNFTAEGMHLRYGSAEEKTSWDYFKEWHEDNQAFILLPSEAVFYCLPKRVMSDAQSDELRSFLLMMDPRK